MSDARSYGTRLRRPGGEASIVLGASEKEGAHGGTTGSPISVRFLDV
jgi:hypothetical protein